MAEETHKSPENVMTVTLERHTVMERKSAWLCAALWFPAMGGSTDVSDQSLVCVHMTVPSPEHTPDTQLQI